MAFEVVIFDLDETLYPRQAGVMQEIGRRIHTWLCTRMGLNWEEAVFLRRLYYWRYGTTLGGLIAERKIDVRDYLSFVHDVPLDHYLKPDPALGAMLASIPLRKVIYTNAPAAYGWRVLRALDVAAYFECVLGIEELNLRNKPCPEAYERVLALLGVCGDSCIMVDDSARNLRPAKALGMTTVLVDAEPDPSADFVVDSVLEVGEVVKELLALSISSSEE